MAFTEIIVNEESSGQPQAPDGIEGKQAWIAAHGTKSGFFLVDTSTDCEDAFGAGDLANELKVAQANADAKFWAVVYLMPEADLVAANLDDILAALGRDYQASLLVFPTLAVDKTFLDALSVELAGQANLIRYYEALVRFRKAYVHDLNGKTATQATGTVTIPIGAHSYDIGDDILIRGGTALDGHYALTAVVVDTSVSFASAVETLTFAEGAEMIEYPDDYCLAVDDAFELYADSQVGIVAPATQDNWIGAIAGRIARIPVHESAGRVKGGALIGVDTDPDFGRAQLVALDSSRTMFLKRFPQDLTSVYLNDDLLVHSATDDCRHMSRRRMINKAMRLVNFHALILINEHKFPRNNSGAMAAAKIAATGARQMVALGELGDYELTAAWTANGISCAVKLYDFSRVKFFDGNISITEPEENKP